MIFRCTSCIENKKRNAKVANERKLKKRSETSC